MPKPSRNSRPPKSALLADLFGIDLRSLAAFRIALAGLVLVDLVGRAQILEAFYTDAGALPRALIDPPLRAFSLHLLSGALPFQALLFALAGMFALALLLGYRTRLATIGSWVLLTSLHVRNLHLVNGGDDWLRAMLLWSTLLPLGARWSWDARRASRKLPEPMVLSVAGAALLLQFAYVYLCAGFTKSGPEWHSTGTAIQAALGQPHWVRPLGQFLGQYPEFLRILTPTVVYFEIAAALLLFLPFSTGRVRGPIIVSFWLMQLGFGLCLQVNLFPWISTAATLPFLPSRFWERLSKQAPWLAEPSLVPEGARKPERPRPPGTSWVERLPQALAGLLVAWVVLAATSHYLGLASPGLRRVRSVGYVCGLLSTWNMYSAPPSLASSYEVTAKLKDGTLVDLLSAPDVGREVRRTHRSPYGRLYLAEMAKRHTQSNERQHYLLWMCRRWNADQTAERQVEKVQFIEVKRPILTPGPPRQELLLEGDFSQPNPP